MLQEIIVLFGGSFRQRLEPVRAVCHAHFHSPLLHSLGHLVGDIQRQIGTCLHHFAQGFVHVQRKIFKHFLLVEHILGKVFRRALLRRYHFYWAFLERFLYNFKSEIAHN